MKEKRNGAIVKVAGCVITRQRPGTAKGFVFLSLEDETGIVNAIVQPDLFDRRRQWLPRAATVVAKGILQNLDGVVSVRAADVEELLFRETTAVVASHDFRCIRPAPLKPDQKARNLVRLRANPGQRQLLFAAHCRRIARMQFDPVHCNLSLNCMHPRVALRTQDIRNLCPFRQLCHEGLRILLIRAEPLPPSGPASRFSLFFFSAGSKRICS